VLRTLAKQGLGLPKPISVPQAPVPVAPELPVAVQEDTPAVQEGPDAELNGAPAGGDGDVPMSASVCVIGGRQVCAVMEEYDSMIAAANEDALVCGLLEVTGFGEGWQPDVVPEGIPVYGHKSGLELPREAVRAGREREIGLMSDHGMYDVVMLRDAKGKRVRCKWLDDWGKEGVRCRLVAMQINTYKREDVTQNTPPLVAVRLMVSRAATLTTTAGQHCRCLAVWDCSVAFYHAPLDEDIVALPPAGLCPPGFAWQLKRAMNGTRKASQAFGKVVKDEVLGMPGADFVLVAVSPMTFYSLPLDVALLVHGDDFFGEGTQDQLSRVGTYLDNKFRINLIGMIGPGCNDTTLKMLKREISFHGDRFEWAGDPKHRTELIEQLGLLGAKLAATPGTKQTVDNLPNCEDALSGERVKNFQSGAGKLLYHSADDPRVQFETNMVMRGMANPTELDHARLMRVVRYLVGAGDVVWVYKFQSGPQLLYSLSDSDHASDEETRRSVSSSHEYFGGHLLGSDSSRQNVVAISSGEAEFYAIGFSAARVIFLKNMMVAMNMTKDMKGMPKVFSDSSAGRGINNRSGVGKLKHMQVRFLWSQQAQADGEFALDVIDTTQNTADLGTKFLAQGTRVALLAMMPLREGLGRGCAAAVVGALTMGVVEAGSIALATDDETLKKERKFVNFLHWVKELCLAAAIGAGGALLLPCGCGLRRMKAARLSSPTSTDEEALSECEAQRCWLADRSNAFLADVLAAAGVRLESSKMRKATLVDVIMLLGVVKMKGLSLVDVKAEGAPCRVLRAREGSAA
jgi:hypothetical protein